MRMRRRLHGPQWRERAGPGAAAVLAALLGVSPRAALSTPPRCLPDHVPESAGAALDAVAACRADDRLHDGVAALRAWLARRPDDAASRVALARLLTELGDLPGATAEYDRVLAAGPDAGDPAVRRARADVLAWSGRLDDAVAEYRRVVAVAPDDAAAWLGLGLALDWQDRLDASEAALREAVRADPGNGEAREALDRLLASPAWLARRAERARAEAPDDPARWAASVEALTAAERWWDAEPLAATAAARFPGDARLRRLATDVERRRLGRLETGLADARDALARDPDDRAARLAAAAALAGLGRGDAAQAEYERAHARWPGDEAIARELARQASYTGDTGRALALYDRLADAHPDDATLALERARVLSWDGQLTESAHAFARLAEVAPAAAARGTADAYRWGGHLGLAAMHYRSAARYDPDGEDGAAAAAFFDAESGRVEAGGGWSWLRDSDDFRRWRLAADASARLGVSSQLGLGVASLDYAQHGDAFSATRPRLTLLQDLGPRVRLALGWGPNVYDHAVTQSGSASVTGVLGPETTVVLTYDHYDVVDEVLTAASARDPADPQRIDPLEADRVRVAAATVLPWRFEAAANAGWAFYTDGNRHTQLGASLGRRVLRRPGLRLGWEGSYLSYAERSTDAAGRSRYWDPPDYLSNALVVRARHALATAVRLSADGRVGWGIERGHGSLERAAGAGLELGPLLGLTLELGGRWGQTARAGGEGDGYEIWSAWATLRWRPGGS